MTDIKVADCMDMDPEEVGEILVQMYNDIAELYGDDTNEKSID